MKRAMPANVSKEEAEQVLIEMMGNVDCSGWGDDESFCPEYMRQEINDFETALRNVNVWRKMKYCPETDITDVEIIIKPKEGSTLQNFRFYEYIPKECIEDLYEYLNGTIQGDVHIEADPLIVWHFDQISGEETLRYSLNKELSDKCKRIIQGLAVAELASGDSSENTENQPPVLSQLPVVHFNEDENKKAVDANEGKSLDLDAYVKDPDNSDRQLDWSFSGNSHIEVKITGSRKVNLKPEKDWFGEEEITFTVSDPSGLSDSGVMKVIVSNVNDAPVLSLSDFDMVEDEVYNLDLNSLVTDADNDEITWSYEIHSNITVEISNGIAKLTPDPDFFGNEEITFIANDGTEEVSKKIEIEVINVNDAPKIKDIPKQDIKGGETKNMEMFKIEDFVSDPDGDSLEFGITAESNTDLVSCEVSGFLFFAKKLKCKAKKNKEGSSEVTLTASDGEYSASKTFTVSVSKGNYEEACVGSGVSAGQCGRQERELDARTAKAAQTNARGICISEGYPDYYDYETETHSTSCGKNYGLTNWMGDRFVHLEYGICGSDVTIISRVRCRLAGECVPSVWTPSKEPEGVCIGEYITETSDCGTTRKNTLTGTKRDDDCCQITSWSPSTSTVCSGTSFTQTSNCGSTRSATGTKSCVASLSASYSNVRRNTGSKPPGASGNVKWAYWDVILSETSGSCGITVQKRQKCYNYPYYPDECGSVNYDIPTYYGSNHISSGGSIVRKNDWGWTDEWPTVITETFWGVADPPCNNNVQTSYTITIN